MMGVFVEFSEVSRYYGGATDMELGNCRSWILINVISEHLLGNDSRKRRLLFKVNNGNGTFSEQLRNYLGIPP